MVDRRHASLLMVYLVMFERSTSWTGSFTVAVLCLAHDINLAAACTTHMCIQHMNHTCRGILDECSALIGEWEWIQIEHCAHAQDDEMAIVFPSFRPFGNFTCICTYMYVFQVLLTGIKYDAALKSSIVALSLCSPPSSHFLPPNTITTSERCSLTTSHWANSLESFPTRQNIICRWHSRGCGKQRTYYLVESRPENKGLWLLWQPPWFPCTVEWKCYSSGMEWQLT